MALALHKSRDTVISEMENRISNDVETEIDNALEQIGHITRGRVAKKFAQT